MKKLIATILFTLSLYNVNVKACVPNPTATAQIIATMCHSCVFPLSVGGVQLIQGVMPDPSTIVSSPICVCNDPFPRIGIPVSFFEPSRIIEVVSVPFCFSSLGIPAPPNPALSGTKPSGGTSTKNTFMQVHYMIFPVYALMEIATDFVCLQVSATDYAYISEVDPTWQDDTLAAFLNPEALLFGNPISNLACIADSVSSSVYFPLDPLFWCMGSWGNAYPLTGHKDTSGDFIQDTAAIAARMIYKLHRELVLWGSWGQAGLCGYYPMPIWRKTPYRLQPILPIPHPIGIVIGQTGLVWSMFKNIPMSFDNFAYMLFKKRECCAF